MLERLFFYALSSIDTASLLLVLLQSSGEKQIQKL